jgi:hypothetical protein
VTYQPAQRFSSGQYSIAQYTATTTTATAMSRREIQDSLLIYGLRFRTASQISAKATATKNATSAVASTLVICSPRQVRTPLINSNVTFPKRPGLPVVSSHASQLGVNPVRAGTNAISRRKSRAA